FANAVRRALFQQLHELRNDRLGTRAQVAQDNDSLLADLGRLDFPVMPLGQLLPERFNESVEHLGGGAGPVPFLTCLQRANGLAPGRFIAFSERLDLTLNLGYVEHAQSLSLVRIVSDRGPCASPLAKPACLSRKPGSGPPP